MGLIINALKHPILISYLSGANNYSFVHFRTGEQLLVSKSLSFLEKQLPDFIRIHKTLLLNPDCILKLQNQGSSKTGGAVLLEDGTVLTVSRRQWPLLLNTIGVGIDQHLLEPERSIAFVTNDVTKSLLLRQLINAQWPMTLLHVTDNGSLLSQLLVMTGVNRPELLLFDLRQATPNRIALIQELKETPRLRRLPIVLLIAPNTGLTRSGYALKANSIVVIPEDNSEFLSIMEEVCRYWLTMASLPTGQYR
ncbi:response regulator transcription factor [Fibrella arboris]|uniref:response regulator transcription factor n=1 Tax=Fibrella arboris TaxID=3242486 RepID=UPI0035228430